MTWYAISFYDTEPDPDGWVPGDEEKVWTVSRNPWQTGWDTDDGCGGYGLSRADAEYICRALNEYEAAKEGE